METLRAPLLNLTVTKSSSFPRLNESSALRQSECRLSPNTFPTLTKFEWKFSISKRLNSIIHKRFQSSETNSPILDDSEEGTELLSEEMSEEVNEEMSEEEFASLPAKEKRKIRNKRRQSSLGSSKSISENAEEDILKGAAAVKLKVDPLKELEQIHLMGQQWWMISLATSQDAEVVETIKREFNVRFPDLEYEVFLPTVISHRLLKDGSVIEKPVRLAPGSIYLRCILTVKVFNFVKGMGSVRGIAGTKTGRGIKMRILPDAVSETDITQLKEKVEEERKKLEEAFILSQREREEKLAQAKSSPTRSKTVRSKSNAAGKAVGSLKPKSGAELAESGGEVIESGESSVGLNSTVRILSGPFRDLDGEVMEVMKNARIKISVNIFGRTTSIELEKDQFQVIIQKKENVSAALCILCSTSLI